MKLTTTFLREKLFIIPEQNLLNIKYIKEKLHQDGKSQLD
jgi:hypothetical protein